MVKILMILYFTKCDALSLIVSWWAVRMQAGSSVLWAPLVASYLFTFIVLRWLHRETAVVWPCDPML